MEGHKSACRVIFVRTAVGQDIACLCDDNLAINDGDQCVFEYNHIVDFGRVSGIEYKTVSDITGRVLRRATLQDYARNQENELMSRMAKDSCIKKMQKFQLNMRFVKIHYSFDKTVLMVVFCSPERQDFRQMVKELSQELNTRVEMRQIGVRDEARIIGGIGPCGRCFCCTSWIKKFDSVNVKMAKIQKLSLNPDVIGGNCGRLKCCLYYEADIYKELFSTVPHEGDNVLCEFGEGEVLETSILTGKVKVRLKNDGRECMCKSCEIKITGRNKRLNNQDEPEKPCMEDSDVEMRE